MSPTFRKVATALLLIFGVQLWLVIGHGVWGSTTQLKWILALAVIAAIPPIARRLDRFLEPIRHPTPRGRIITAAIIFALSLSYLLFTAIRQHRDFEPKLHDQHMYALQTRMLAAGRLWMPQHPAADSFETFYVLVKPVYAPIYFPGTALLFAPAVWLGLPLWVMPLLTAAGIATLMYLIVGELLDGLAGILAALLLISLTEFRYLSIELMSHTALVLLGLLLIWSWLRWRQRRTIGWCILIGVFAGWAAIVRPIDAICFAAPVGVAMALTQRRDERIKTAAGVCAGAAPFILLQLVMNWGVTGSILTTPVAMYQADASPQFGYGFVDTDKTIPPRTTLPQKLLHNERFVLPTMRGHRLGTLPRVWAQTKFPRLANSALPSVLLLILIPPGMLLLDRRRAALFAVLPLFILLYAPFAFLLAHYCLVPAPTMILGVLMGAAGIESAWPRMRAGLSVFLIGAVAMLAITSLPEFNRLIADDVFQMKVGEFDHRLPRMIDAPAIVLYHFDPAGVADDEPVYNDDVVWPDDAPIIRAHDLSPTQNAVLFRYYAKRQPDRRVYRVDCAKVLSDPNYRPEYLGTVADLAKRQ